jgi:hypothetical protein
MRFSNLGFFIIQPHLWPLFTGKSRFANGLIFAEKIENIRIAAGSMTSLKAFWRSHWPRQNDFRGVIDPAETILAGSLTPPKLPEFFLRNCETIQKFHVKFQRGH